LEYGWMMKLRSTQEVMLYFQVYDSTCTDVSSDFAHERISHFTHQASYAVKVRATTRKQSPVEVLGGLIGEKMRCMFKTLPVYVNRNGGWFHQTEDCTETEVVVADRWPEEHCDPEYKQWPGGKHWYCSVGGVGIEIDGEQKWNSYEEAVAAYRRWRELEGGK
jgi:hypothetical protein